MVNQTYILNPDYHFKNDAHRIVMYSTNRVQPYSQQNWIGYIHPMQAEFLLPFTNPHPISWHYENFRNKYSFTTKQTENIIRQYLENKEAVYTEWGENRIVFPKNVLIPYKKAEGTPISTRGRDINLHCQHIDLTSRRMYQGPQSMLFMLTAQCATKCKYCYADRSTPHTPMPTSEILRIIDEAHEMEMSHIDLIGGEVFCHRDWDKILQKLVDYDLTPSYISTKVPIGEAQIKRLKSTGYDNVVQLSLDSLDDNVLHEIIGSGTGYADRMKKAIRLLEQYGFNVQIDTILTKYNCNRQTLTELDTFIKTLSNLVYWEIRVPTRSIYYPESFGSARASRKEIEELRIFVQECIKPSANYTIHFSDEAMGIPFRKGKCGDTHFKGGSCGVLENRCFLLPDGQVTICEQLYWNPQFIIGDLRKQSIAEVWNSPRALHIYHQKEKPRPDSRCSSCKILDFCTENRRKCVVKVMQAYGKDNWDYPDPRCEFAPPADKDMVY